MSRFTYFSEDDALEYDYDLALSSIESFKTNWENAMKSLMFLVDNLYVLQDDCHDIEGTKITEDYLDFATLIGSDEYNGINGFLTEFSTLVDEIDNTIRAFYNATH